MIANPFISSRFSKVAPSTRHSKCLMLMTTARNLETVSLWKSKDLEGYSADEKDGLEAPTGIEPVFADLQSDA